MERVNWNQAVRPSTHDLIAAINSGADDIDRIDGALDDIETALDGKAGVSGTYPDFVAGEALSIRSGIRSNTFLSRALDSDVADGIAEVDRILGNTVVWNQLAKEFSATNYPVTNTTRASFAYDNGVAIATPLTTGFQYIGVRSTIQGGTGNPSANHVCYMAADFYTDKPHGARLGNYASQNEIAVTEVNKWVRVETIYRYSSNIAETNDNFLYGMNVTEAPESGDEWRMENPVCIDLTLMFGAGNEPTIAEFEAQYGSDYKPYSAPTLLSSTIAGIEGAGSCEFPTQTLRSAGMAHDVMTRTGIERVIGQVDLGTLTWTAVATNQEGVYRLITDEMTDAVAKPENNQTIANIRCADYASITLDNTYLRWTGISIGRTGRIAVYDANYNASDSAAAFKTAMSGVILQYEVATPTTETFSEPIDLTYRVEADGTEAWIVPDDAQSAAVTGEIAYPLDPARALITHESFADFCDKLGAYIGATITETWDGSKYTYSFASGRSALLGSIEAEPDALEVTEKDDMVKEIIEDERKEL